MNMETLEVKKVYAWWPRRVILSTRKQWLVYLYELSGGGFDTTYYLSYAMAMYEAYRRMYEARLCNHRRIDYEVRLPHEKLKPKVDMKRVFRWTPERVFLWTPEWVSDTRRYHWLSRCYRIETVGEKTIYIKSPKEAKRVLYVKRYYWGAYSNIRIRNEQRRERARENLVLKSLETKTMKSRPHSAVTRTDPSIRGIV